MTNDNNENGEATAKFYHVDLSFTDEAFVRCSAGSEDEAKERAINYVAGQGIKNITVLGVKEVESLVPEEMEGNIDTPPNTTIN